MSGSVEMDTELGTPNNILHQQIVNHQQIKYLLGLYNQHQLEQALKYWIFVLWTKKYVQLKRFRDIHSRQGKVFEIWNSTSFPLEV